MGQILEDIVNKERRYSTIAFLSNLSLSGIWFHMHVDYVEFSASYNWLTGHLGDFAKPAAIASIFMYLTAGGNRYLRNILPFLPAAVATYNEFRPFLPSSRVFDLQDIALQWLGTGIAYGGVKLLSSEDVRERTRYAIRKIFDIAMHKAPADTPF